MTARFVVAILLIGVSALSSVYSWSTDNASRRNYMDASALNPEISRRWFIATAVSACSVAFVPAGAHAASSKVEEALEEMRASKEKLQAIPDLLEEKEWDKVRSILKLPPVNKLWNLGDVRAFVASLH
jgi:hypothetical protein